MEGTKESLETFYEELFNDHYGYIYTVILNYIGNNEVARELTQDVFLKAFESLSTVRGHPNIGGWLTLTARRAVADHMRKEGRNPASLTLEDIKGTASVNDTYGFEDLFDFPGLGLEDRLIIRLFYEQELTVKEISVKMNISVPAVKTRLYRAKKRLGKALRKQKAKIKNENFSDL